MKPNTVKKFAQKILEEHPEIKQIYLAIDEFKKTGNTTTRCVDCESTITVIQNKDKHSLDTNCYCGKCNVSIPMKSKQTLH